MAILIHLNSFMLCAPLVIVFECAGFNSIHCILTSVQKKEGNYKRSSQKFTYNDCL